MSLKNMCSIEKLAGQLISAIQKEWNEELGKSQAEESENVMYKAHDLLQAAKENNLSKFLDNLTITDYLGKIWVKNHSSVLPYIEKLESHV